MTDISLYDVVATGELQEGFELAQVQASFAALFKIPPEKAQAMVGVERTIKKNTELQSARTYQQRLEKIGLVVKLRAQRKPSPLRTPISLALEPTEEERRASGTDETKKVSCPKCGNDQVVGDQCENCGVFISKFLANQTLNITPEHQAPAQAAAQPSLPPEDEEKDEEADVPEEHIMGEHFSPKSMGLAVLAAFVGAFVWKFIAVTLEIELAFLAWLIGGAIGFAAAIGGARGQKTAIACAVLAAVAILGGKYWMISSFQANWEQALSYSAEAEEIDFNEDYIEELEDANIFLVNVQDDDSLRTFMIDRGYAELYDNQEISNEELQHFKEYTAPRLEKIANEQPSYDQWFEHYLKGSIENISTFALLKEQIGLLDFIFLFLGIGTAYRLGLGQETS